MRGRFFVTCSFLAIVAAGCGDSGTTSPKHDLGTDGGTSTDMGPSKAGTACMDDPQCGDPSLTCDTMSFGATAGGGFCSGTCSEKKASADEAAECGGAGSTCVTLGDSQPFSYCTKSCKPTKTPGCRADQICTGWAFTHAAGADSPGCTPFCHKDSECASGQKCNSRTGECNATGVDMTKLADGSSCTQPTGSAPSPCRGLCFGVPNAPKGKGVCGSFIDLAVATGCPDDDTGMSMLIFASQGKDNMALCIYKSCACTANCSAVGLSCDDLGNGTGGCEYHDPMATEITSCSGGDGGTGDAGGGDASTTTDGGTKG